MREAGITTGSSRPPAATRKPLRRRTTRITLPIVLVIGGLASVTTCDSAKVFRPAPGTTLSIGTWGGDNAGVIVTDSGAHVHVGCTFGDAPGRILLDTVGRFSVAGSYLLRAYPVAIGPTLPAQFAGRVDFGKLTLTVTVNDTVEKKIVVMGPVTVIFGREPSMGPCPICRVPGERKPLR